jgi:uncharacterized protein YcaQ
VTEVHRLSHTDARRIAVQAQLLATPRPTDVLEVARHLGVMQADQTAVVAPSAELVAWSRLGAAYAPGTLDKLMVDGSLIELRGMLRPAEDIALFRAEMEAWPGRGALRDWEQAQSDWVEANDGCRRDILEKLYDEGPLPSRDLPDTTLVPWESSGWNNDRNVRMLLSLMVRRGEVAMAGWDGRDRLWDLAERVYPDDPVVPYDEAMRIRGERHLRSMGITRARGPEFSLEPLDLRDIGEPAVVDGVRGKWRVDPAYLDTAFRGRAALLSPLDRLIFDRKRMTDVFDFEYQLEMYKPVAKRRWGYWAMPIVYGDRLVGKLDATAERDAGVLRVDAVHEDDEWTPTMRAAVEKEVRDLARWLDLELVRSGGN